MEGKADQKLWLRQVDIVIGIDVGNQFPDQSEAFRSDKILQIGNRDALVVNGRGPGDEEQRQLVDLGLVVFDPEILLDLSGDPPRQLVLVGADGGHVPDILGVDVAVADPVDGDGDVQHQVDQGIIVHKIMKPVENLQQTVLDQFDLDLRENILDGLQVDEVHVGLVVENGAEQPALVFLQAGYGQIVMVVVQLEIIFAQLALYRLKVVFDGGVADKHLVAEVVGVDGGIALDQTVDDIHDALLGRLGDVGARFLQNPSGGLLVDAVALPGGLDGLGINGIDLLNIALDAPGGHIHVGGQAGSRDKLRIIGQNPNQLNYFRLHIYPPSV